MKKKKIIKKTVFDDFPLPPLTTIAVLFVIESWRFTRPLHISLIVFL